MLILALLLFPFITHANTSAIIYSGRAFGAQIELVNPQPNTLMFSDTGELPSSGGTRHADLASISVGGTLSSVTIVADCSAGGGVSNASASQQNVSVFPLQPAALTASLVTAQAHAECGSVSGSSVVGNLVFAGNAVKVTGEPNQTIMLGFLATLIINEQIISPQDITVNAIHLKLGTGESIILSSAHADITSCTTPINPKTWGSLKVMYR